MKKLLLTTIALLFAATAFSGEPPCFWGPTHPNRQKTLQQSLDLQQIREMPQYGFYERMKAIEKYNRKYSTDITTSWNPQGEEEDKEREQRDQVDSLERQIRNLEMQQRQMLDLLRKRGR